MTDLLLRLHTQGAWGYFYNAPAIQIEAADRIEKLEDALKKIDAINDNPVNFSKQINDVIQEALGGNNV